MFRIRGDGTFFLLPTWIGKGIQWLLDEDDSVVSLEGKR
jgi:hypothetical protein